MVCVFDDEMFVVFGWDVGVQCLCCFGLVEVGDIVQFVFDVQQCGIGDCGGVYVFILYVLFVVWQQEFLEYYVDCIEVVFGWYVQYGVVFVVEVVVCVGIFYVVFDQVGIEILV